MLKITTSENGPQRVLKLEGKLLGPWTSELVRACRQARGAAAQTSLDLSAITFIDTAGVVALRELQRMGVTIGRSSPFVAEMLNGSRD
jgi:ABC-type transporter Mla MlaB component